MLLRVQRALSIATPQQSQLRVQTMPSTLHTNSPILLVHSIHSCERNDRHDGLHARKAQNRCEKQNERMDRKQIAAHSIVLRKEPFLFVPFTIIKIGFEEFPDHITQWRFLLHRKKRQDLLQWKVFYRTNRDVGKNQRHQRHALRLDH